MSFVIGIGLRATATIAAFDELAKRLGAPPDCSVALPDFRADIPLVAALRLAGRHIVLIPGDRLQGVKTPSQSPRSLADYGTGSVAEACALRAFPECKLIATSLTSADRSMTAALAQACRTVQDTTFCERPFP